MNLMLSISLYLSACSSLLVFSHAEFPQERHPHHHVLSKRMNHKLRRKYYAKPTSNLKVLDMADKYTDSMEAREMFIRRFYNRGSGSKKQQGDLDAVLDMADKYTDSMEAREMFIRRFYNRGSKKPKGDLDAEDFCEEIDDNKRNELWNFAFFAKWNHYPIKAMHNAAARAKGKIIEMIENDDSSIDDEQYMAFAEAFNIDYSELSPEQVKEEVRTSVENGLSESSEKALDLLVGQNVAGVAAGHAGEESSGNFASGLTEQAVTKLATQFGGAAASKGLKALSNPTGAFAVAVSEQAASFIAEEFISDEFEDKDTVVAATTAGTGILASIAVGAMAGGPFGAGAAGLMSSSQFIVTELSSALMNTQRGPPDNWVYFYTGDNVKACAKTYNKDDKWRAVSYDRKSFGSNEYDVFSAGNEQNERFQVEVYKEKCGAFNWSPEWTIKDVYYQDSIFVSMVNGTFVVVHASGGVNPHAGMTTRREFE